MPAHLSRFALLLALASGVALLSTASAQSITVALTADVPEGATLGVRGDTAPLAWDRSTPLTDDDGDGVYTATLAFPEGTGTVSYKAVIDAPEADPAWEPGGNRLLFPGRMDADRRAFGAGQTDLPELTVSSQELIQDLGLLRRAMEQLHPGLRLHNTDSDLIRISDALSREARVLASRYGEAIPMPEAYLAVSKAVASIRDGHTQVSMFNQGAYTESVLYSRADRVPFAFRLIGGRMVVTGDATPEATLPAGTEILTLDGRPVAEIIADLMPYASADGGNDAKRVEQLQVSGTERVAARFDVITSLLYDLDGPLALTVRRPGESETAVSVARMTAAERREVLLARDDTLPRSYDDLLQYRMLDDRTAYLKVGTFATFNMNVDYNAWLTEAFADMNARGAERLVVDVRGCAGGMDDAAALLFRHILQEPVTVEFWNSTSAYDVVPESLRPHVGSWSDDFYDLSDRVTPVGDGTYRFAERAPILIAPAPEAFEGPVAVLVDAAASSATFYLADRIQSTGAATLVGQTTGGSLKGLNAGQMVFLTLPNTGVVVDVPLYGARPAAPGPDRGVIPDVHVEPDADAVIAGRDPEMEAALAFFETGVTVSSPETPEASGAAVPSLQVLDGDWTVDLRPTPEADAYTMPMTLRVMPDGLFSGTFYGTSIGNAAINDDWGALRIAFTTSDGSGTYHSVATLRDGVLNGTTHSPGRGFLSVWTAMKNPGALPLADLAGDWTGTLTYTEYNDDATRVTLSVSASGEVRREGSDREGAQLTVSFVEPDGSSGGQGTTTIENNRDGSIEYDGNRWTVVSRSDDASGWTAVIEAEDMQDNNRPATIRHELSMRDGVFTDRKLIRYEGTDAFFERNTFRFARPE